MENAGQQYFQTSEHKSNELTLCLAPVQLLPLKSWQWGRGRGRRLHVCTNDYDTAEGRVRTERNSGMVAPREDSGWI